MAAETLDQDAAASQRLFVYNGGFLTNPRIKRILSLAGYDVRVGLPSDGDLIGVWGKSPTSPRGEAVADRRDTPILRVEDAFLRSVHPGRSGSPPLGLFLDTRGVHFDHAQPSDLEVLLATHPLDDTALLNRARNASARLIRENLSKYNAFDPDLPPPNSRLRPCHRPNQGRCIGEIRRRRQQHIPRDAVLRPRRKPRCADYRQNSPRNPSGPP